MRVFKPTGKGIQHLSFMDNGPSCAQEKSLNSLLILIRKTSLHNQPKSIEQRNRNVITA